MGFDTLEKYGLKEYGQEFVEKIMQCEENLEENERQYQRKITVFTGVWASCLLASIILVFWGLFF